VHSESLAANRDGRAPRHADAWLTRGAASYRGPHRCIAVRPVVPLNSARPATASSPSLTGVRSRRGQPRRSSRMRSSSRRRRQPPAEWSTAEHGRLRRRHWSLVPEHLRCRHRTGPYALRDAAATGTHLRGSCPHPRRAWVHRSRRSSPHVQGVRRGRPRPSVCADQRRGTSDRRLVHPWSDARWISATDGQHRPDVAM
jgi:hypothetical protein